MATVNVMEGIRYGFGLMGYLLVVGIVGGIVALVGGVIASDGGTGATVVGGLIAFAGILVIYAGSLGIIYKVIADGVSVGVRDAEGRS